LLPDFVYTPIATTGLDYNNLSYFILGCNENAAFDSKIRLQPLRFNRHICSNNCDKADNFSRAY
jgi:hypothetical protein